MRRRDVVVGGLIAGALVLRGAQGATIGKLFLVRRNGREIGTHRVQVAGSGSRAEVTVEITLEVKLAFIPVYRYRHRNDEVWEDGGLLRLVSRTDDNGTRHEVQAERRRDGIEVTGTTGSRLVPLATLTTTYWDRRFMGATEWLDTQSGRLVRSRVELRGAERVVAGGRAIDAERFRLDGDLKVDLWYAGDRWVKLAFAGPDGSAIEYELLSPVASVAAG